MIRTYVDTGVLITAARGTAPIAIKALEILDDPNREFVSSVFLKLEILPKAIYYRNEAEAAFYNAFFDAVTKWADSLDTMCRRHSKKHVIQGWLQWMLCMWLAQQALAQRN